jgi:uncharacterized membrane protein
MKKLVSLLKSTAVGGFVFLVPLVIAVAILAKGMQLMRLLAQPLEDWISLDSGSGILVGNLALLFALLLVCLLAGLVAKSPPGRKLGAALEAKLSASLPGYGFVKGITDSIAQSDEVARSFTPVLARFDDNAQVAFEVERLPGGNVVVYLPGAPNPWSGTVVLMSADRVARLDLSMTEAIKSVQGLGRGSAALDANPSGP